MSYERYESQRRRQTFGSTSRRTTLGYWIPLAVTVTVATIGLVAWVWKERTDEEEEEDYRRDDGKPPPAYSNDRHGYVEDGRTNPQDDPGLVARMSGALRRTQSPKQIFDEAGRRFTAGVAAAGAAVGGALGSIREENKGDYEDHMRWSKEVEARGADDNTLQPSQPGQAVSRASSQLTRSGDRDKKVAIVVSAETSGLSSGPQETTYLEEHASILSHIPEHMENDIRVFVVIYSPDLEQHPLFNNSNVRPAASIASSFSNIGQEDLQTPAEEADKPLLLDSQPLINSGSRMFNALYSQARTVVDKETMIMPFTTRTGYISLLKQINPSVVYVQEVLSGDNGDSVKELARWAGQVVLVVGDETGHGGLVDSEDERGLSGEARGHWWKEDPVVGKGKGIEVVEGLRVGEDWRRRVKGHD